MVETLLTVGERALPGLQAGLLAGLAEGLREAREAAAELGPGALREGDEDGVGLALEGSRKDPLL